MAGFKALLSKIGLSILIVAVLGLAMAVLSEPLQACPTCSGSGSCDACKLRTTVLQGNKNVDQSEAPADSPSIYTWFNTCHFTEPWNNGGQGVPVIKLYWGINPGANEEDFTRCYNYSYNGQTGEVTYQYDPAAGGGLVEARTIRYEPNGPFGWHVWVLTVNGYTIIQFGTEADHMVEVYDPSGQLLQEAHYLGMAHDAIDYLRLRTNEVDENGGAEYVRYESDGNNGVTVSRNPEVSHLWQYGLGTQRLRQTRETYDSAGNKMFSTAIYAYYGSSSGGESGQLHYVVPPANVARYLSENPAHGVDPDNPAAECGLDSVADQTLLAYASTVYETYDDQSRVTYVHAGGSGASCCGGQSVKYGYGTVTGTTTAWASSYRRMQPVDGSGNRVNPRSVEFYNSDGQIVFSVVQQMDEAGTSIAQGEDDHNQCWISHNVYDSMGHTLEYRHPSACKGYGVTVTTESGGTAGMQGEWVTGLTPDEDGEEGLVDVSTYYGADVGYKLQTEGMRNGTSTGRTTNLLATYEYVTHSYSYNYSGTGSVTVSRNVISAERHFWDFGDWSTVRCTTYAYRWVEDAQNPSNQIEYMKVTNSLWEETIYHYARVQPGSEPFESFYYNDWTRRADGTLSYTRLGTATSTLGQTVLSIEDVKTDSNGNVVGEAGLCAPNASGGYVDFGGQWANENGQNLKTTYEYYSDTFDSGAYCNYGQRKAVNFPGGRRAGYAEMALNVTSSGKVSTLAKAQLSASHMTTAGDCSLAPIQISVSDLAGRTLVSASGVPSCPANTTMTALWNPSGTIDDSFTAFLQNGNCSLQSRTVNTYNVQGQRTSSVQWSDADDATKFKYTTLYAYDSGTGQLEKVKAPDNTVTLTQHDQRHRVTATYQGVSTENLEDVTTGDLKRISTIFYDQVKPGISEVSGIGDGNMTASYRYSDDAAAAEVSYRTVYNYDWLNQLYQSLGPDGVARYRDCFDNGLEKHSAVCPLATLDNDGVIQSCICQGERYSLYDSAGRLYETQDIFSGGAYYYTDFCYDAAGRRTLTIDANGLMTRLQYDGAGRLTAKYLSFGYSYWTGSLDDDTVIEQSKYSYDDAGNVWLARHFSRWDTASATGELNDPAGDDPQARVTYAVSWFDVLGRTTKTVNYGTHEYLPSTNPIIDEKTDDLNPAMSGTQTYTSTGVGAIPAPNTSDSYIVSDYSFNVTDSSGRYFQVTANNGAVGRTYVDDLGRTIRTVENYDNGTVEATDVDKDRTTEYVFDSMGRMACLKAYNADGVNVSSQCTYYVFGDSTSGRLPTAVLYPDTQASFSVNATTKIVTIDSGSDFVSTTYNRAGGVLTRTDQQGTQHVFAYDSAGRLQTDSATVLGTGVDDYVRSVGLTYNTRGQATAVTCYSETGASGTVRNEVAFAYDGDDYGDWGFGGVKQSRQAHAGLASESSPAVDYLYEDSTNPAGSLRHGRVSRVTYPGPSTRRQVYYNYSEDDGVGEHMSRLDNMADDSSGTSKYAQYTYLGAGTIVQVAHPAVSGGLWLTYKGLNDGSYPGFDRFGRVIWQRWQNDAGGVSGVKDRYFYGYDRASNRIWRAERKISRPGNGTMGPRDQGYVYDNLNRLTSAGQGVLTGLRTGGVAFAAWPGDSNADGQVNTTDYTTFTSGGDTWLKGDYSGVGSTNVDDYNAFAYYYSAGLPARNVVKSWSWGLDALGNWGSFNVTTSGQATLTQTRTHNAVNEIDVDADHANTPGASITASVGDNWVDPKYDAAGNMTSGPKPGAETTRIHMKYNAWNKLVEVRADNDGDPGDLVAEYRYDGLNRRIAKFIPSGGNWDRTDYYYNENWQCLEERFAGNVSSQNKDTPAAAAKVQWLWDVRYIDAPVCRWRDDNSDGDFADAGETLYYCNDANMNVTALVNASNGAVVERYQYEPYGTVMVCDSAWTQRAGNASAYSNEILFGGYRFDPETGLNLARNRYYHPTLGRWTGPEPGGVYRDGPSLYQYVVGIPSGRTDPDGRQYVATQPASTRAVHEAQYAIDNLGIHPSSALQAAGLGVPVRSPPTSSVPQLLAGGVTNPGYYACRDCGIVYKRIGTRYTPQLDIGHSWVETPATIYGYGGIRNDIHYGGYPGQVPNIVRRTYISEYGQLRFGGGGQCANAKCKDVETCLEQAAQDWGRRHAGLDLPGWGQMFFANIRNDPEPHGGESNCIAFAEFIMQSCCLAYRPQ
jgi:RHS repeat-associated protein